ncbi:MAG: biopolymer transporter ExbD [Phycisphaeraceae bacterium]
MSRRVGQSSYEPRIEMTPLLDVIFLLLTFFIYSLVVTVNAEVLPVALPQLGAAVDAERTAIAGITVDEHGELFLNREAVTRDELRQQIQTMAEADEVPAVFLALDAEASAVDRGPLLLELIDMLRRAGVDDFHIVGHGEGAKEATEP